jgi:hypothetical protein
MVQAEVLRLIMVASHFVHRWNKDLAFVLCTALTCRSCLFFNNSTLFIYVYRLRTPAKGNVEILSSSNPKNHNSDNFEVTPIDHRGACTEFISVSHFVHRHNKKRAPLLLRVHALQYLNNFICRCIWRSF